MEWIAYVAILLFVLYVVLLVVRFVRRATRAIGKVFGGGRRAKTGLTSDERRSVLATEIQRRSASLVSNDVSVRDGLRWYGPDTTLKVGHFRIQSPLTYASDRNSNSAADPSEINVRLPVQAGGPLGLTYWPWYSRVSPAARFAYLDWLQKERKNLPDDDGLLFLFFYGLERRALFDGSDRDLIFREVLRLRQLDAARPRSSSFRGYSGRFLAVLAAQGIEDSLADDWMRTTTSWEQESLVVAIARLISTGRPIPARIAFALAELSPKVTRGNVVRRLGEQLRSLFDQRYQASFGSGLTLQAPHRVQTIRYRSASNILGTYEIQASGAPENHAQFSPILDLWNAVVEDLRKLSRLAPTGGDMTAAQWEATPRELRAGIEHPLASRIRDLLPASASDSAVAILTVGQLAGHLGVPARPRLTVGQSRELAETVAHCELAIEPDVRHTGRGYSWDAFVALFPNDARNSEAPSQYAAAARIFQLGVAIAAADGKVDDAEIRRLRMEIEGVFHLDDGERRRLDALRAVLLAGNPEHLAIAKNVVDKMSVSARRTVGRLLVVVAVADGVVTRNEMKMLRQGFRQLRLEPEVLEKTLAELAPAQSTDLVAVQAGVPTQVGEAIPPPPGQRLDLDHTAIHSILIETREVAQMLAEAMGADDDEEASEPSHQSEVENATPAQQALAPPNVSTSQAAVPTRYAAFCAELVQKDRWSRGDADLLARKHGHMLDGAIEALNDWSYEIRGSSLVDEDGDGLLIART